MTTGKRDRVRGKMRQVTGQAKAVAGKLTDNPKLQVEGALETLAGKAQEKLGQVKKVFSK